MCGVNFKHKMQRVTFKEKIMPKQKKNEKKLFSVIFGVKPLSSYGRVLVLANLGSLRPNSGV